MCKKHKKGKREVNTRTHKKEREEFTRTRVMVEWNSNKRVQMNGARERREHGDDDGGGWNNSSWGKCNRNKIKCWSHLSREYFSYLMEPLHADKVPVSGPLRHVKYKIKFKHIRGMVHLPPATSQISTTSLPSLYGSISFVLSLRRASYITGRSGGTAEEEK